jgi:hypothetical protein
MGVTGHRNLDDTPALTEAIQSTLETIRQMAPPLKNTPWLWCVLSPLAEGADRLVAREVLKADGVLEVVLPLEKDDYMADFTTEESRREFETLLSQARGVRTLAPAANRTVAYEEVGRYIVEQCDVLIALWDGKSSAGRGGTQEIVQYARDSQCPLAWIHTEDPAQITLEPGRGLSKREYRDLDDYNVKRINPEEIKRQLDRDVESLSTMAGRAGLDPKRVLPAAEYFLYHYIRADKLALRYQHLYYRMETWVYALALAAVIIASFQDLFLPDLPVILVSEIALMLAVLGIIWVSRRQRWHERWLDDRFLAERFRAAIFMAAADIGVAILKPPRHLSLAYSSKDWMVAAFTSVWCLRPRGPVAGLGTLEGLKTFLGEAWLEDQIRYYEKTSQRHRRRHRRMTAASYILFGLTIAVVIARVLASEPPLFIAALTFLAVIFPAVAASVTAIKTHRDYLRTSLRAAEMARHLHDLKDKMEKLSDYRGFAGLVKETEETMLHENEDWRVVVRFQTTEPV